MEGSHGVARELVDATVRRFSEDVAEVTGIDLVARTDIPRSVGLAGSSAIVIATLRVLESVSGTELSDDTIASLAHTVERVDLGIAGGWQDQVIQSRGVPLLMEFGEPRVARRLEPAPISLYLAWSERASEPSGDSHAELRRHAHRSADLMRELAALARTAATAMEAGDLDELRSAIDSTFDIRCRLMTINPVHRSTIETARAHGAAANFAGSGGAVVGVVPDEHDAFTAAMRSTDHEVITWTI